MNTINRLPGSRTTKRHNTKRVFRFCKWVQLSMHACDIWHAGNLLIHIPPKNTIRIYRYFPFHLITVVVGNKPISAIPIKRANTDFSKTKKHYHSSYQQYSIFPECRFHILLSFHNIAYTPNSINTSDDNNSFIMEQKPLP